MTPRMREVLRSVTIAHRSGAWYRAARRGERCTLAYLLRHGAIVRRAWRGVEGDPDAAHEYALAEDLRVQLGGAPTSALLPGTSPTEAA